MRTSEFSLCMFSLARTVRNTKFISLQCILSLVYLLKESIHVKVFCKA